MTLLRKSPLLVIFCEFIRFLTIFFTQHFLKTRNSRQEVFCKRGVLRIFAKLTGKHLCRSLFFNKVAGLRSATSLKKRLLHRCFPVIFASTFSYRTPLVAASWRLLLQEFRIEIICPNLDIMRILGIKISKTIFSALRDAIEAFERPTYYFLRNCKMSWINL